MSPRRVHQLMLDVVENLIALKGEHEINLIADYVPGTG
jgi:hypothetical protein